MNEFRWGGAAAEVRWAWHQAAVLGPWTMTTTPDGQMEVTAQIASSDETRLEKAPLTFVVPRGDERKAWTWPIASLRIVGPTLVAHLGPQEG